MSYRKKFFIIIGLSNFLVYPATAMWRPLLTRVLPITIIGRKFYLTGSRLHQLEDEIVELKSAQQLHDEEIKKICECLCRHRQEHDLDHEIIRMLALSTSLNHRLKDSDGNQMMLVFLLSGQFDAAERMLRHTLLDEFNIHGKTMLHEAVKSKNIKVVKWLVEHGANPDQCSKEGFHPIQYVEASQKSLEIGYYLLEKSREDWVAQEVFKNHLLKMQE